jgi:cytochrome c oxidase subunit 2
MFRYLPEQASEHAPAVDWLNNWITDISLFFTVVIVGAMIYFSIRYRQKDGVNHETPRIEGSNFLEVIWTVVPTIICIFVGYYGIVIYRDMVEVPTDEPVVEVLVHGRKWQWEFEYDNGKKTTAEFVLPVNKQAKLILRSTDVLHSLFIPAMRVKNDAVPGMFTYVTFKPVKTGEYYTFCTEYCGKDHSAMLAKLKVVSQAEYDRWLNDRSAEAALAAMTPEKRGQKAYAA